MSEYPQPDADDAVGYGKPPKHTQFKKGQSGNPKGRAPGKSSAADYLEAALNATVTVVENGRRRKRPKFEVIFTQLVNKASGGDLKAMSLLMRMLPMVEGKAAEGILSPDLAADRELARKLAERWAARLVAAQENNTDIHNGAHHEPQ